MTPEFTKFIETGRLPPSMAARSKILDIARNQILGANRPKRKNMIPEIELAAIRGTVPPLTAVIVEKQTSLS